MRGVAALKCFCRRCVLVPALLCLICTAAVSPYVMCASKRLGMIFFVLIELQCGFTGADLSGTRPFLLKKSR